MKPLIAGLFATALLSAGSQAAAAEGGRYVAMGSSFAAGPGVAARAEAGPCNRSTENYARQLARMRGLDLVDRSCGGATTEDVLRGGQFGLPPQIDALTPDTRLVTVTIGGNDVRYMADLGVESCRNRPEAVPEALRARLCAAPEGFDLEAAFAAVEANLRAIAAEVRSRSPQAKLVFVDYVTVLPPGGPCAATPLSTEALAEIRDRAARLEAMTAKAAADAGAGLVRASALTRGHDACAADPWVEGFVRRDGPAEWGPVSYHPRLAAMTAVGRALAAELGR